MSSEIFPIISPVALVIGQFKGEIVAINPLADFNKSMRAKYPELGKYPHARIRPWRDQYPHDRAFTLAFTNRRGLPHLKLSRDYLGRAVADISQIGLLMALFVLEIQRGKIAKVEWLIAPDGRNFCDARDYLDAARHDMATAARLDVFTEAATAR